MGRNVRTFGVNMSSSTKIDKRKKDILIFGKGPSQGLEHTLTAEKMYSINFTEHNKTFCLSLHYNGTSNYLFMVKIFINLRQKMLRFSNSYYVREIFQGYVYDFSID